MRAGGTLIGEGKPGDAEAKMKMRFNKVISAVVGIEGNKVIGERVRCYCRTWTRFQRTRLMEGLPNIYRCHELLRTCERVVLCMVWML